MDATYTSIKKSALFLSLALLLPAAASAQTTFLLNGGSNLISVSLISNQSTNVMVTSSANQITFSAATTYAAGDLPWLCIGNPLNAGCDHPTGLLTPATLSINAAQNAGNLSIGTHTATINLTATDGSGATGSITVSYTTNSFQGGGTGSGSLSVFPSTPSTSVSYGSATTLAFQVSTSGSANLPFTLVQPGVTWATNFIQTSGTSGVVGPGSPATFSVTLNGAGQLQTTLATSLTINFSTGQFPVNIQFGNGVAVGTGGTTSGTLSLSQNTVNLSYVSGSSTFPSAAVTLSSTTGSATSYSFNIAGVTNNWLLIGGQTAGSGLLLPATLNIVADSNVGVLTAGQTYTAIVTFTGNDGSTTQLTINLTVSGVNTSGLTISPNPITLNTAVNGAATSQLVTISSTLGGGVSVGIAGSGLSVSGLANSSLPAGGSTTVLVTGSPNGLTSQTYSGTLTVTVGGVTQYDSITFQVGTTSTGGSGATIAAAPSTMTFAYEINSAMQVSQLQAVYLSGSGSYSAVATVNNGANWLSVTNASGALPQQFASVVANASGLSAGTYTGQVTFTNTSTGQTSTIGVTLTITGTTILYTIPGDLVFPYIAGTNSPNQSQTLTISSSDNTPVSVNAAVSNPGGTPWLTLSSSGALNTGSSPTVTVNANGLANGIYTGAITISAGVANNPLNIPVVLAVTGSSVTTGSGSLTLGASSLTLNAQFNGSAISTTLGVSASTNTTYTVTAQGSYNGVTWLNVSPSGTLTTSGNPNLTVTATPYNFPVGTYSGSITLQSGSGAQTVNVTMVIGGSSGTTGQVTVTANNGSSTAPTLTYTASAVGVSVPTQFLSISSAAGQSGVTFQASANTSSGGNWLTLSTASGTLYSTPYSPLTVTANTTGLAAGTYTGTVTVSPTGGTAVSIPVTLTIAGGATISAPTTPLSFSFAAGGSTPASQTVNVSVTNATSGAFTATATSTPAGWLAVTPASGTAPGAVTVSVTPTGLAAGTYNGSVTIAAGTGATGSVTIPVTLSVTVPLPTITSVVNGASFVSGPVSPGEIISIFGTSIGPATPASLTLDSTGKFVTTTLGGDQVLINGYSAPLTYVSATQVNAIVPYEIAGIQNPTVLVKTNVTAGAGGQTSNGFQVTAAATAAGIFTQTGTGTGPGAILNSNLSVNGPSNPASRGSIIVIYMTGEGQTSPQGVDGKVTAAPYPAPLLPIAVTVGGAPATVTFMGEAPGLVSGVLQLNVMVPSTLSTTGAVPVSVAFGGGSISQAGVTVAIQ